MEVQNQPKAFKQSHSRELITNEIQGDYNIAILARTRLKTLTVLWPMSFPSKDNTAFYLKSIYSIKRVNHPNGPQAMHQVPY